MLHQVGYQEDLKEVYSIPMTPVLMNIINVKTTLILFMI